MEGDASSKRGGDAQVKEKEKEEAALEDIETAHDVQAIDVDKQDLEAPANDAGPGTEALVPILDLARVPSKKDQHESSSVIAHTTEALEVIENAAQQESEGTDLNLQAGLHKATDVEEVSNFLASVEKEEEEELFDTLRDDEKDLRAASTTEIQFDASKFDEVLRRTKERISVAGAADSQHLLQFDNLSMEKKLKISSVPKEQVAARLELIRKRQRENREKVRKYFEERENDIVARERAARDRVVKTQFEREHKVEAAREAISANLANLEPRLRRAFIRREEFLRKTLANQDAKISEVFGVLHKDYSYGARKLIIDTSHKVPQKVAIRVDVLRGVKDKLARGKYQLGIYVLDELAGARILLKDDVPAGKAQNSLLAENNALGDVARTRQFSHNGRFDAFEVTVHDSVMVMCPPRRGTRRSNVFILEVFRCADWDPTDIQAIVGWTALPVMDADGGLCRGRFKLPMLKGAYNGSFDRYHKLESAMAKDLDRWLCNLYVHVEPVNSRTSVSPNLDLGLMNQDLQASVDMDFAQNFESMQANEILQGEEGTSKNVQESTEASRERTQSDMHDPAGDAKEVPHDDATEPAETNVLAKPSLMHRLLGPIAWVRGGSKDSSSGKAGAGVTPITASLRSREARKRAMRTASSFTKPTSEELDEYQYALHAAPVSRKAAIMHQLSYLSQEAIGALQLQRMRVNEGWMLLLLTAASFYIRMFAHYGGQYVYLRSGGYGAAYSFQVLPFKCVIKFADSGMPLYHLVNLVVAGSFAVLVAFSFVALVSLVLQLLLGRLPGLLHKFVLLLGIMTLLDPIITILVDGAAGQISCENFCAFGKHASDCFCSDTESWRVISYFYAHEGSVLNAVYLLLLVYSTMLCMGSLVLALYMVFVHRDGRSHDLYRRLFGAEGVFFVPDDTEVSSVYVNQLWHRSLQWKGPRGLTREVSTSTHNDRTDLEIFEISRDGSRALWRVFTHLPNGMMVEEPRERK
ncbi:Hypothetical Protein FCC1311_093112 [Hondaea fermentalgiana]|uniref:Uncharacterized protein n=1 Tax=Hondaea fermentalgiana TaxID=2315210 RepID=A0A2R5GQE7_9STRA|nr:Hypothetical Protein FCC1311_093112 [Hondaea fermentalgiana]|eukprot:GBG33087.1 Hypothetical Protein FCC1311_093112 [Hondaea fermentalgiana]